MAIPSLLAVSAMQQHLIQTKKRTAVAMILESGEPREIHHFATLLGYGACAINPYLAQDTIEQLVDDHLLDKDYYAAINDYNSAVLHGIVKIASKMGISTIQSYQGSKILKLSVLIEASLINILQILSAESAALRFLILKMMSTSCIPWHLIRLDYRRS